MTLNVYHAQHFDAYLDAVDRIAELGFNALHVVTPAFQKDGAAAQVEVIVGPGRGPRPEQLVALLKHAQAKGLTTVLMPQVNLTEPRGNEWRGKIQPPRWQPWWDSYRRTIEHFLDIAIAGDADVFTVGCELLTTEKPEHQNEWQRIIADCRRRFDGRLTYSTVWNHYHAPPFWDRLDVIGISGYWDLTRGAADPAHPTGDELAQRWRQIQQNLFDFADAQDRPVLITELGYPSLPWALKDPWNYVNRDAAPPDVDAQAAGYASFIAAWDDLLAEPDPRLAGVLFYKWDVHQPDASRDTGYGVAGKPAYDLLANWLE